MKYCMFPGIQTFLSEAGESACYSLDIIKLAEQETGQSFDVIGTLKYGIDKGFIEYDWDNPDNADNFFVRDPAGFLSYLTGAKWMVSKQPSSYGVKPDELAVQYWERRTTGKTWGHFRLIDWDPLRNSQTVRYGHLTSWRIFRRAK